MAERNELEVLFDCDALSTEEVENVIVIDTNKPQAYMFRFNGVPIVIVEIQELNRGFLTVDVCANDDNFSVVNVNLEHNKREMHK